MHLNGILVFSIIFAFVDYGKKEEEEIKFHWELIEVSPLIPLSLHFLRVKRNNSRAATTITFRYDSFSLNSRLTTVCRGART